MLGQLLSSEQSELDLSLGVGGVWSLNLKFGWLDHNVTNKENVDQKFRKEWLLRHLDIFVDFFPILTLPRI